MCMARRQQLLHTQVLMLQAHRSSKHGVVMDGLSMWVAAKFGKRSSAHPPEGYFPGLSKEDAYIRLVNAYRLRADDDNELGGGYLHG